MTLLINEINFTISGKKVSYYYFITYFAHLFTITSICVKNFFKNTNYRQFAPAMPLFHGHSGTPYSKTQQNIQTSSFDHGNSLLTVNTNNLASKLLHQVYCISNNY